MGAGENIELEIQWGHPDMIVFKSQRFPATRLFEPGPTQGQRLCLKIARWVAPFHPMIENAIFSFQLPQIGATWDKPQL